MLFRSAYEPIRESQEARDWERFAHVPKAEELIERAGALLTVEDQEQRLNAIKALQREWRELGQLPRERLEEIARRLRIGRTSVRRILAAYSSQK